MPAMLDTMAYSSTGHNVSTVAGGTPWHGDGTPVTDPAIKRSAKEFIKSAQMDWEVGMCDLATVGDNLPVPNRAVYRYKDGKKTVLNVVGPNWQPLQNINAFEWFQPWLDAGLAEFETAGSLFDGQRVWVLAKLALDNIDIAKGDTVMPYILLSNTHGIGAVKGGFNPIRAVCWNTLSAAIAKGVGKMLRVRHTSKLQSNLDLMRDTMNLLKQDFEATALQYKHLASKGFNQEDIKKYVKILLDVEDVADKELPTRTVNRMEGIFKLIFAGKGQDNPSIANTWWAAYNGYNEYLNYVEGRTQDNRMDNLWFGQGINKNSDALQLALDMAG